MILLTGAIEVKKMKDKVKLCECLCGKDSCEISKDLRDMFDYEVDDEDLCNGDCFFRKCTCKPL
jgi:hypothetical protein